MCRHLPGRSPPPRKSTSRLISPAGVPRSSRRPSPSKARARWSATPRHIRDGIRSPRKPTRAARIAGSRPGQPPLDTSPRHPPPRDLSRGLAVIQLVGALRIGPPRSAVSNRCPRPLHAEQRRDPIGERRARPPPSAPPEGTAGCGASPEPGPSPATGSLGGRPTRTAPGALDGSGHVGLCSNQVRASARNSRAPQGWQVTPSRGVHGSEYAAVRPIAQATQHPPLPRRTAASA